MKLVTTGTPSALASAATLSSSPKRRTSTSAMMTGARARRQALQHLLGAGRHRLGIDRRRLGRDDRGAVDARHVARDLDVDRPRVLAAAPQHARDGGRRRGRVVEPGLVAGDLLVDARLAGEGLRLVVQEEAALRLGRTRPARDHDQRRLLGVGPGDRVDHVERARPVGDGRDAELLAVAAGGVGREADGGLVAERVERQRAVVLDDPEERQREVAGDAEDLLGPVVLQRLEQGLAEPHGTCLPAAESGRAGGEMAGGPAGGASRGWVRRTDAAAQPPRNTAGRFSRNAATPSR